MPYLLPLDGPLFEPLKTADPLRLLQKTFLLLLATGRLLGVVSALSWRSLDQGDHLVLKCVPGFLPKHHTPTFQPSPPSLWKFVSEILESVSHCPIRAFKTYLNRSASWLLAHPSQGLNHLWVSNRAHKYFKQLIIDALFLYASSSAY